MWRRHLGKDSCAEPIERVDGSCDLEGASVALDVRNRTISIGARKVGSGEPCFVIAEAGVNHNGSFDLARELVDVAVGAGCDAVKFQTFKTEKVCSPVAPKATYQMQTTAADESQIEMVRKLELPFDAFRELHRYSRDRGIIFLSTPFDYESADFLAELPVPAFKIPSGEITNLFFLESIARKGQPLILSTGMATMEEVAIAVELIRATGNQQMVLLQCVSNYPASPSSMNLRAMHTLEETFGVAVGLSDHTVGSEVAFAAVALGACVIEKHFTLDHELPGPDHRASLEPQDLARLVTGIRNVESALGDGIKQPAEEELNTAAVARRSLVAARFIPAGAVLTVDLLDILRPGTGLPPAMRSQLLGRHARHDIEAGAILRLDMLA
jgi:N,N'-diacetyllegionaminate synthase